jgi:hypothetical protein
MSRSSRLGGTIISLGDHRSQGKASLLGAES